MLPPARDCHQARRGLGRQQQAADVDGEDGVDVRGVDLLDHRLETDAGVGDADVEAAEEPLRLGDDALDLRRVGDVAGETRDGRAPAAELGGGRLRALRVAAADHEARALACQGAGDGEADPARAAGDQRHLAGERGAGGRRAVSRAAPLI